MDPMNPTDEQIEYVLYRDCGRAGLSFVVSKTLVEASMKLIQSSPETREDFLESVWRPSPPRADELP